MIYKKIVIGFIIGMNIMPIFSRGCKTHIKVDIPLFPIEQNDPCKFADEKTSIYNLTGITGWLRKNRNLKKWTVPYLMAEMNPDSWKGRTPIFLAIELLYHKSLFYSNTLYVDNNQSGQEDKAKIIILPIWYKKWIAYFILLILILIIAYFIRYNYIKQKGLQKSIVLLKTNNDQENKTNELKFKYLTDISHELVSASTLIFDEINELIDKSDQNSFSKNPKSKLNVIIQNANRLNKIIKQLQDHRQFETDSMVLKAQKTNIVAFIDKICVSFREQTKQNNIHFQVKYKNVVKEIWCDMEKVESIVNNLLSNSLKNVSNKGKIKLVVDEDREYLIIRVIDNGIGISKTETENILKSNNRNEMLYNRGNEGVGLTLVKNFVDLHKGKMFVYSTPHRKTEFNILLKKGNEHLNDSEKIESNVYAKKTNELYDIQQEIQPIKPLHKLSSNNKIKILVVEHNPEIRNYLKDLLSSFYSVQTVNDGQDGFEKAVNDKPDLIILDIMIPIIDGFKLCQKLKNHIATKLIPIILLTVKSTENFAVLALQAGAEDYIAKPFDPSLLLEKASNILHSRKILKENYSKKVKVSGTEIEITPYDEKFIKNCINIIESNFLNPKLNAEMLAKKLNLSRSSLYRKLKTVTGYSINQFIRKIRLDRAVQLLKDYDKTISEIAYDVGFNDLKYFRTCFKKQFGTSPINFRKENISG